MSPYELLLFADQADPRKTLGVIPSENIPTVGELLHVPAQESRPCGDYSVRHIWKTSTKVEMPERFTVVVKKDT